MQPPVFILGLHRSGTTLLYQMLAASGAFNVVTARHVIYFERLRDGSGNGVELRRRLGATFQRLGLADRGVDAVGLCPDTPEEYGFILDKLHAGLTIKRRNVHVFRHFHDVVQRDCGNHRPLLLKSPWDFGRAALIQALIPGAKVVYIHREPFRRLSSLYRVVIAATTQRHTYLSLLSPRYRALTESGFPWRAAQWLVAKRPDTVANLLISYTAREARAYLRNVRTVHPTYGVDVQFEALCRWPDETIRRILQFLDVSGADVDYASMIGAPHSTIVPPIARKRDLLISKLGDYATAVGYDPAAVAVALAP